MKFSIISFLFSAIRAIEAFDISSKLTGGKGYEYEIQKTTVTTDISTECESCEIYGGIASLVDGNPFTKFIVEADSAADITSNTIHINVDVRYDTRKTHLNHLSITSGDNESSVPSKIRIQARDDVNEAWESIHEENTLDWAGGPHHILFNNHNSYSEYRLVFYKKANTNKVEIADCDIINKITSSLAAETYYKLTDTMLFSPSTVEPKNGFMLGMISNPSKNFMVSVNIIPGGVSSSWSNIYVFKDDPNMMLGMLGLPGLDILPNTYKIFAYILEETFSKEVTSQNSLTENDEYTVATKVLGDVMTLYVDGQAIKTVTVNFDERSDFTKLYAFVSEYPPANVVVKGLHFINLKND